MARRKGLKRWDEITEDGWLALMGDTSLMTHLMMQIFFRLYQSTDYMGNAKNLAETLHMEYRALNSAVGQAGNKIKKLYEEGKISCYPKKKRRAKKIKAEKPEEFVLTAPEPEKQQRSPWEYVFDGVEGEDGLYFWVLKPEAAAALREMADADIWGSERLWRILDEDETSSGVEGNLFSMPSAKTVQRIRHLVEQAHYFKRKSLAGEACCAVCGARRLSLLQAVPYGDPDFTRKGLLFCPTHGALFAAHLISFNDRDELLISPRLSGEERKLYGLTPGMKAKVKFSHRRMADHRREFKKQ